MQAIPIHPCLILRNLLRQVFSFFIMLNIWMSSFYAGAQEVDKVFSVSVQEGTNMAAAVSPDGKMIAIDIQGTIGVLPIAGGNVKLLTDGMGDERQPSWSPDGKQIVFQSFRDGNYHLWTINKEGTDLKQITFGIYDEREPYWSPDGKSVLFSSDRSGNYDIWRLSLSDRAFQQLTTSPANEYSPACSPDGRQIAFISSKQKEAIYIIDESGNERQVPSSKGTTNAPSWSPDGKRIIFNAVSAGKSELVMVTLASGAQQTISKTEEDVFPFRPTWMANNELIYTADGKILHQTGEAISKVIPFTAGLTVTVPSYPKKIRDFDGEETKPVKGISGPVVSPDGKTIAFTALGDIWLLKEGESKPLSLTHDVAGDIDAAWSYDGKKLAFASDREGGNMNIWIHDFEMKAAKQLTFFDKHALLPSFSPDGKKIAFFLNDGYTGLSTATLYTIELSSGETKVVYKSIFTPGKPSWSADGKWIVLSALQPYSSRYREGISRELLIAADGSSSRYLSPVEGRTLGQRGKNGPVWSPDGHQLAYIQEGVLWTMNVNESGESLEAPVQLTSELAESPSWTGDSGSIVFIATDRIKKANLRSGRIEEIPLSLEWKQEKAKGQTVIYAGRVFNGRSDRYLNKVDIVIEDNRIKEIVPHQPNRTGHVIDASDKTVIPGLFEMHTHQTGSGGELLGRNWLAYGITSVRETGGDPYDALERKESWSSGVRPGPRLFFTGPLLDGERVYYDLATGISSEAQLNRELNRAVKLDYDFIKTYVRFPDQLQKRTIQFAHAHGIPVSSHEIYPAASFGADAVEHLSATSRRGYTPKLTSLSRNYEDVVQLLARSGMNMTPTVALYGGFYLKWQTDPDILNNKQLHGLYPENYITGITAFSKHIMELYPNSAEQFAGMKKTLFKMQKAGVKLTAGTDSPFITYGLSLHVELQNFVEAGFTPFQALQSATLLAAEATGVDKDLGTIEPGKLADLVIVSGDPLKNIKEAWNVEMVIKNGLPYTIDGLLKKQ